MALTTQEKLDAAESAYHDLITGAKPRVVVDQNGERVEFTAANSSKLAQYIKSLKNQLYGNTNPGPMQAFF